MRALRKLQREQDPKSPFVTQVNAIAGLTHKFTPNFLVGVLAGCEHFDVAFARMGMQR